MKPTQMELRLLEDVFVGGRRYRIDGEGFNRVLYVVHGQAAFGGVQHHDDQAFHSRGAQEIVAGPMGATIWRYELAAAGSPLSSLPATVGSTREKLTARLDWPVADDMLIRVDSVSFPPGGCAYHHTHQGPGIRCLIEGGIRIDTEGHSTSYGPGGAWFEGGPAPVFAQAAEGRPSRFIRVMVLPAALKGRSSIQYVHADDREKPKSQTYKGYVDELITV